MKKKTFLTGLAFIGTFGLFAQETPNPPVYQFTTTKELGVSSTEDQCASGTCWSFATISFIEAEIIRKGQPTLDLSEMFNVRVNYPEKVESYVRYQGKQQIGPGGLSHDVIFAIREFGLVPESAYTGLNPGKTEHDHGTLDAAIESWAKTVLEKKLNEGGNEWILALNGIMNEYLGEIPSTFTYNGKSYSPTSFRDAMKINPDDYVSITSFSHHPFYSQFILEVPDNWAKGSFYNVPMEDMQMILDNAIDNGYSVAWDADVSEKGFSFKNGMAIVPDESVTKEDLFKKIVPEKKITQDNRQAAFDSFQTTDDHLMHITGKSKDQNGNVYYITKNSWGTTNPYGGYQHVSKSYFQYKTVSIMVHKDAIPAAIRAKLKI